MKRFIFTLFAFFVVHSSIAQKFELDTIQWNGDYLINIVIMGDGYTQEELTKFVSDSRHATNEFFNESPFSHYQDFFNVILIKVPSNVSGAANRPDSLIDNYFGSSFHGNMQWWGLEVERLLRPMREQRVRDVLRDNFPNYDQAVVIVNDERYGGSGGWLSTFSTHFWAGDLFLHEMAHSFADLSDEYWAGNAFAKETINMTQETNPSNVRWRNWYGTSDIGIYHFEDTAYLSPSELNASRQWRRPHQDCKMFSLDLPFCAVCQQGIINEILKRVPNVVSSFSPKSTNLDYNNDALLFELNLIRPTPNTLQIKWLLNDSSIDQNNEKLSIDPLILKSGKNSLKVTIQDTTSLLRLDVGHNQFDVVRLSTITWTLEKKDTATKIAEVEKTTLRIYPNPIGDMLYIESENLQIKRISIVDFLGRVVQQHNPQNNYINVSALSQGIYVLRIETNNEIITQKIIKE
jgi:hypothetical protein